MIGKVWGGASPSLRRGAVHRTGASIVVALATFGLALARPAFATQSPIGAHSMLQLNDPEPFMQAMFAEAYALHASYIRLDVTAALMFPAPSQPPDFSGLNEVMSLSERYGVRVVADLVSVPAWLADCPSGPGVYSSLTCATDDLTEYGSMVRQIVAHADPIVADWEIWNEPDASGSFSGTPSQYAWMLRTAYDAVKEVNPDAQVLLGGISSTAGMAWLEHVFAVPGADAMHAFDIANVHERNRLDWLAQDVIGWKRFLNGFGFTGPLWITEHGYPSDPAFQFDPEYVGGDASQAAYLAASIPTLLDAGAAKVFVTERDNLRGQFASEGVLGGDVSDPPVADPNIVEKPAYSVVRTAAECYRALGRDCPGPPPEPSQIPLYVKPSQPGRSSTATETFSDRGATPISFGSARVTGVEPTPVSIDADSCSNVILEPDQTCTVTLRFAPVTGGAVTDMLEVPSDDGMVDVPVAAVAPSVSSLEVSGRAGLQFKPFGALTTAGRRQRLRLRLTDPLTAPVRIGRAQISGPKASRFSISSNRCRQRVLVSGARCVLSVLFSPTRFGMARATLTVRGNGLPLVLSLAATASRPPRVVFVRTRGSRPCLRAASRGVIIAAANRPATLRWSARLVSDGRATPCITTGRSGTARATSASGKVATGDVPAFVDGTVAYVARFTLPVHVPSGALRPGTYLLAVTASDPQGRGKPRTIRLRLPG